MPSKYGSGADIYTNGLLRGLLSTGAEGTLIASAENNTECESVSGLVQRCIPPNKSNRAWSLFSSLQSDAWRIRSVEFAHALEEALDGRPDVVFIDYYAMGWTLDVIERSIQRDASRPLLVYVSHNYEASLRRKVAKSMTSVFKRCILTIDARKAANMENRLVATCDLVTAITEEDSNAYRSKHPDKTIITLTPGYSEEIRPIEPLEKTRPRRVIVVGAFEWINKRNNLLKFLDAANDAFMVAGIEMLIVGRSPEQFMRTTEAKYSFCKFTGKVDEVLPYLSSGRIGLMPDEVGGGFKHKYLYYIFNGLPVAAFRSEVVGLPVDAERDMIVCDTSQELVRAIVESIDDLEHLDIIRQRCYRSCATAFRWSDRSRLLRSTLDALLKERCVGDGYSQNEL